MICPATTLLARASAITSDHLMRITQEPIVISYYALLLLPAQSYTGPQHWTKNEKDSATVLLTWPYILLTFKEGRNDFRILLSKPKDSASFL